MTVNGFDPARLRQKYRQERDKRLRPDGNTQYLDVDGDWAGLTMAARLDKAGVHDFLIADQAGDFGGVWYWNRYPGVRCDKESYFYMPLLEEIGTVPSEKCAGGPEMLEHARAIGRRYDLYSRALLGTTVTEVADAERRWADELARVHVDRTRYDAECTPSYYNNEGNLGDPKPTVMGGQYGRGPVGYLAVLRDRTATGVDRDLSITRGQL